MKYLLLLAILPSLSHQAKQMRTAAFLKAHLYLQLRWKQTAKAKQITVSLCVLSLPSSFPSALALLFGNAFHVLIESALPLPVGELPLLSEFMVKEVRNNLLLRTDYTDICLTAYLQHTYS